MIDSGLAECPSMGIEAKRKRAIVIESISTDGDGRDHALHDVRDAVAARDEADERVVTGLARLDRDPRPLAGTEGAHAAELAVDRRRRLMVPAEPLDEVVGRGT